MIYLAFSDLPRGLLFVQGNQVDARNVGNVPSATSILINRRLRKMWLPAASTHDTLGNSLAALRRKK